MRTQIFAAALSTLGLATAAHAEFEIDRNVATHTRSIHYENLGDSGVFERSFDCGDEFDQGVVRSWYLRELNHSDFRSSYHFCREMDPDGTLATGSVKQTHFDHTGGYTQGNSLVPLTDLPVGVRVKWDTDGLFESYDKLVDVNLLYNSADDIIDGGSSWSMAGYALGRVGDTVTLECNAGSVMVGLRVLEKTTGTGGNNQSEIVGVRIECADLDEY